MLSIDIDEARRRQVRMCRKNWAKDLNPHLAHHLADRAPIVNEFGLRTVVPDGGNRRIQPAANVEKFVEELLRDVSVGDHLRVSDA